MDNKITTIRLTNQTKSDLKSLKEYPRETDEEVLIRIINYIKQLKGGTK